MQNFLGHPTMVGAKYFTSREKSVRFFSRPAPDKVKGSCYRHWGSVQNNEHMTWVFHKNVKKRKNGKHVWIWYILKHALSKGFLISYLRVFWIHRYFIWLYKNLLKLRLKLTVLLIVYATMGKLFQWFYFCCLDMIITHVEWDHHLCQKNFTPKSVLKFI